MGSICLRLVRASATAMLVACLIVGGTLVCPAESLETATSEQIEALFAAGSRKYPVGASEEPKMRLIVSTKLTLPPKSREEIARVMERFFEDQPEEVNGVSREEMFRMNVGQSLSEQGKPDFYKRQYFKLGSRYRIDQIFHLDGTPVAVADTNYLQSWVNFGDQAQGEILTATLHYPSKSFDVSASPKSLVPDPLFWEAAAYDLEVRAALQAILLGQGSLSEAMQSRTSVPDFHELVGNQTGIVRQLSRAEHPLVLLRTAPAGWKGLPAQMFELDWRRVGKPVFRILVNQTNYNQVYRTELFDPRTFKVTTIKIREQFNELDFPRIFTIQSRIGTKRPQLEEHTFETIEIDSDFDEAAVFGLTPPVDWVFVDRRKDPIEVTLNGQPIPFKVPSSSRGSGNPGVLDRRQRRFVIFFLVGVVGLLAYLHGRRDRGTQPRARS